MFSTRQRARNPLCNPRWRRGVGQSAIGEGRSAITTRSGRSESQRGRERSGGTDPSPAPRGAHVALALADAEIPCAWAGTEIPGLPTLSEQVKLIAERVIPRIAG
jgi:hypothetical protein